MTSFASISASRTRDRLIDAGRSTRRERPAPGLGELDVIRGPRRSVVSRALATSPLRLLTPANHGHAAWVYTSTYGGGLVDGDAISLRLSVGAGASVLVSTQASTKVYRSPRGSAAEMHADVGRDGLLVAVPDPVVCFAGSTYRQIQRVNLAEGAGLVLVDWISSGRRASGERWAFDEYVSRTTVRYHGRLVVHDATALRSTDGDLATRMGRFDVIAMAVIVGAAMRSEWTALISRLSQRPIVRRADELLAAAPLGEIGCLLRVAGRSVEHVGRQLRQLLGFVPALLGDDPWSRKW
jgi:urease accessory protein